MFLGSVPMEEEGATFERKSSFYPCLPFIANQIMHYPLKTYSTWMEKLRVSSTYCNQFKVHVCVWYEFLSSSPALAPWSLAAYSTLAWKIPWMEEPGGPQSMGSLTVRHNWATSLSLFTFMHWRRKWQSTPVLLPGESQGRGSLVGCHLWGRTVSDMTEVT